MSVGTSHHPVGAWRYWLLALPLLALVLAALRFYPLADMNYSGLIVVVLVLAWLAYHYFAPLALMSRHAFLAHTMHEGGRLRRLLWRGTFLKFRLALYALVTALLVLILSATFSWREWLIMAASIPVFMLVLATMQRLVLTETSAAYHFPFALRGAYWLTLVIISSALVLVSFFWGDEPNTTQQGLVQVWQSAFTAASEQAALPEVGWLLGMNAGIHALMWHLMQVAATSTEVGAAYKIGAWLVFLFINAAKTGVIWTVLGGTLMLIEDSRQGRLSFLGESRFNRAFTVSMLVLFGVYLALTQVNIGHFFSHVSREVRQRLPALDPCVQERVAEQQRINQQMLEALSQEEAQILARMQTRTEAQLDLAFARAEPGVDSFLDWNFSLTGQYAQLAWMGASAVGDSTFTDYLSERIDEHVGAALTPAIARLDQTLQDTFTAEVNALYARQAAMMESLAADARCLALPESTFSLTEHMSKSAVGVGAGAGVVAARAGMRVGSRVVSRTASKRIVSSAFGRLSGRMAPGTLGAASGSVCGPFILLCAPAFAVGSWLAVDLAINEVDERMHREDLRHDMLAALEDEKQRLKTALNAHYALALRLRIANIEHYQTQRFNIRRDGL